jgi:LuxR family maltose regulon positive regulatory protein
VLSLLAGDEGDDQTATALATRAATSAETQGLGAEPLCGIVHLALGQALIRQGKFTQAEEQLERALELVGIDSMVVHRAHGLLLLASARHGGGDLPGSRAPVDQPRALIERFAAPGMLSVLLEQIERQVSMAPRRRVEAAAPLTRRELAVLRLLPTRLSAREIGREFHPSVNTIRSQVQAIHRKLQVNGRAEAVTQGRQLGLIL